MIGKNHIITGIASLSIVSMGVDALARQSDGFVGECIQPIALHVQNTMTTCGSLPSWLVCVMGTGLFVLGTLLPDIDNERSMLGRYVHVPVEHRTWTHTAWVIALLSVAAWFLTILWWLVFGYTVHLFWDSLSRGGVCWFYPFSRYRSYGNGAKVKKGHVLKLYGVGDVTETIVVWTVVGLAVLVFVWYAVRILGVPIPIPPVL